MSEVLPLSWGRRVACIPCISKWQQEHHLQKVKVTPTTWRNSLSPESPGRVARVATSPFNLSSVNVHTPNSRTKELCLIDMPGQPTSGFVPWGTDWGPGIALSFESYLWPEARGR